MNPIINGKKVIGKGSLSNTLCSGFIRVLRYFSCIPLVSTQEHRYNNVTLPLNAAVNGKERHLGAKSNTLFVMTPF